MLPLTLSNAPLKLPVLAIVRGTAVTVDMLPWICRVDPDATVTLAVIFPGSVPKAAEFWMFKMLLLITEILPL